jgi:Ca2+-binding EF-hand superfamily protein
MKILLIITAAALALGLAQIAYAATSDADGKHCVHKMHAHHDIMDADANKDGVISRDEFMSAHQARAEKHFAKMDANNDGKIDQTERDAMKAKWKEHHQEHEMEDKKP